MKRQKALEWTIISSVESTNKQQLSYLKDGSTPDLYFFLILIHFYDHGRTES